jgi:hypothetical protein
MGKSKNEVIDSAIMRIISVSSLQFGVCQEVTNKPLTKYRLSFQNDIRRPIRTPDASMRNPHSLRGYGLLNQSNIP